MSRQKEKVKKESTKLEPEIICNSKYQVLPTILGTGGWGKVCKGIRLEDGVFVAVKKIQLGQVPADMLEGIMNEIDMLKHLSHPNIVKYLDSEKKDRTKELYIVLEMVESGSLADIARIGRFPEQLIVTYLAQILDGLVYLHEQGVIHQDIKGANILLTKEGKVKLADFGIATKTHQVNPENLVQGTPYWMAPEIVNLMGASTKSDIWSLACTVVELLTSKPPYFDLPAMSALFRIGQEDCPPLPEGISGGCRDFLMKCFQKEPLLRPSASSLLRHPWIIKYIKGRVMKEEDMTLDVKSVVRKYGTLRQNRKANVDHQLRSQSKKLMTVNEVRSSLETLFNFSDSPITKPRLPPDGGSPLNDRNLGKSKDEKKKKKEEPKKESTASNQTSPIRRAHTVNVEKRNPIEKNRTEVKRVLKVTHPLWAHPASELFDTADLSQFVEEESEEDWDDMELVDKEKSISPSENDLLKKLEKLKGNPKKADFNMDPWDDSECETWEEAEELDVTVKRNLMVEIGTQLLVDLESFGPGMGVKVLENVANHLMELFDTYSEQKLNLVREQGTLPLLDMLARFDKENTGVVWALRVINKFIEENPDIQESFAILGGIPAVVKFSDQIYLNTPGVHLEVAKFIQHMLFDEQRIMKMFISAQGLLQLANLLCQGEEKETYIIAIDCIDKILRTNLNLRLHIPKNDFCRLWVRTDILIRLVVLMNKDFPEKYLGKLVRIFFTFSKADLIVKQHFTSGVLKETFQTLKSQTNPDVLLLLLKTYRNLTIEDSIVRNFVEEEDSIKALVNLLGDKKLTQTHTHYLLNTLSQMCSFDTKSCILAAHCGIIPHLKRSVEEAIEKKKGEVIYEPKTPRENLKPPIEFILPIMFEFAQTKPVYPLLIQNNCVHFFLSLFDLGFPYPAQAVDALANWLVHSSDKKVTEELSKPINTQKLVFLFKTAEKETFESIIEPILRITQSSKRISKTLIAEDFIGVLIQKFENEKSPIRVNLIKILNSLYTSTKKPKHLIGRYKLIEVVEKLESDSSVIVSEIATRLKHLMKDPK